MQRFRRWSEVAWALRYAWLVLAGFGVLHQPRLIAAEVGRGPLYSVIEIAFHGPRQTANDVPARDVDFRVRFRHESGSPEYLLHGFWDGDGQGGSAGDLFKVRFCPTRPGRWELNEVHSNRKELAGQHQGDYVVIAPSSLHGFWEIDDASPDRRWYRRSDGSHQYIFGNTHYGFLSGYQKGGAASGNDIASDIQANARYFKKLRFSLQGDHYPHPAEKPFFDDEGQLTDSGDYSHRPNPGWFHKRVDRAVQTAFAADLIADLILAGPDTENARATLRAQHNRGDAAPFLRYIAARYGSYPNVWLCLSNEYDIRKPVWTEAQIAGLGQTLRGFLPYPTPVSVHPSSRRPAWSAKFDGLPAWNDHQIIQRKLRGLGPAADVTRQTCQGVPGHSPRRKPTINDELSYQGAGDKHSEGDTIESHLGTFLGGGYASTGHKTGNKTGQYFPGNFDPAEHTAAVSLKWLRERIDSNITFWKMAPDTDMFSDLDAGFRALAWPDHEYALGTNKAKKGLIVKLPPGTWTVTQYDAIGRQEATLSNQAKGRFRFDALDSRAVLFHFKKNASAAADVPRWSVHEIVLTAARENTDATVTATFEGPGGARKNVAGFWDGGRTYRVRFTPTVEGTWTYRTRADDAGLDGQRGTLRCIAPAKDHHGFLRRDAEYPSSFRYDDGTHCFLWGQTYYRLLSTARVGDRWKEAIDQTRAHGMNKVRFYVYPHIATASGPDPAATTPDTREPAYWRKLDEVVRYLGERGMIADLIFMSKNYRFGAEEADRRYERYLVARYAAFPNVAWCLSNEWNYTPKKRSFWNMLGSLVRSEDPWAVDGGRPRLLSVHQQTRWDFQFFDQPWVSHAIVQVGVRNNGQPARVDEFKEGAADKRGRIREGDRWGNLSVLRNRDQPMPVVNDEYGYIGEPEDKSEPKRDGKFVALTREKHRQIIWGIAVAGGYGSAGDKSASHSRPYSSSAHWHDAPEYDDIQRLVRFFSGLEFWKMTGRNELMQSGTRVYVLAEPGRQYVVYAAQGGAFSLELAPGVYRVGRHDPRTGKDEPLEDVTGGGRRSFAAPAGEDWVIHLRRHNPHRR